mmetsp:Transcript_53980/g.157572  ORF Transcript_53980/g.157572 Transcript_53980/m.157572 type:complete len:998 (-) Transcript_53980:87-3080(-)
MRDPEVGVDSAKGWSYAVVQGEADGETARSLRTSRESRPLNLCLAHDASAIRYTTSWCTVRTLMIAMALGAVAIVGFGVHTRHAKGATLQMQSEAELQLLEDGGCGLIEDDVEYHTSKALFTVQNVKRAEDCCAECEAEPRCGAWVWGKQREARGVTDICFLKELEHAHQLHTMKRYGVVSGLPSKTIRKHGMVSGEEASRLRRKDDPISPNMTCPGRVAVKGYADISISSAQWVEPHQRAHRVEVLESSWVVPHLQSRAYWTTNCSTTSLNRSDYVGLKLLGKTLRYTTDMSGAGCGCNAALKLIPMVQSHATSECPDNYCDSRGTCGRSCAEVSIQEANKYAWSSSLHIEKDAAGVSVGYPSAAPNATDRSGWTESQYAPGGECVDTSAPFEVAVSFPTDGRGSLAAMEVRLSQRGRSCRLAASIEEYMVEGRSSLPEISKLLDAGLTPVISYSGSKNLQWLDGLGKDGSGPCVQDTPASCADTVRFYAFSIEQISGEPTSAAGREESHPSALAEDPVELAIGDLLQHKRGASVTTDHTQRSSRGDSMSDDPTTEETLDALATVASTGKISEWEVASDSVPVKSGKNMSSATLSQKYRGMLLLGHQDGDWLALDYEAGYIEMSKPGTLKKREISFSMISEGSCADRGAFPILDMATCRAAGIELGYIDTIVKTAPQDLARPEGCYLLDGELWLSTSPSNVGRGKVGRRLPICSSIASVTTTSTTTETSTTTQTTTTRTITTTTLTTTTAWGPSLFCFNVITMSTYEPGIVRSNMAEEAGIFACEAYRLFTESGVVKVGTFKDGTPVMTTLILQLPDNMKGRGTFADLTGATCFNTETFLRVWHTIVTQGLYEKQDWTVKVDPDAVFMPHRLANKLIAHTPAGGSLQYLKNCNKFGLGPRMFGAIEVYSRKAVEAYKLGEMACIDFPWKGWGEDYFMEKCLDKLGVGHLLDFSMVADERCSPAPCSDRSKVAFHAYKNLDAYHHCWKEATLADAQR